MIPAMFSAELVIGKSAWRFALEHDPGTVRPKAGGRRGEMLRWTGATTNLHLGPIRFCLVWKDSP